MALDKLISKVDYVESEGKYKISFMKVNSKTIYSMDGADILIFKEFIGDYGIMDWEMVLESGLTHKAKFLKEIGIWEYSNDQFIIYLKIRE